MLDWLLSTVSNLWMRENKNDFLVFNETIEPKNGKVLMKTKCCGKKLVPFYFHGFNEIIMFSIEG